MQLWSHFRATLVFVRTGLALVFPKCSLPLHQLPTLYLCRWDNPTMCFSPTLPSALWLLQNTGELVASYVRLCPSLLGNRAHPLLNREGWRRGDQGFLGQHPLAGVPLCPPPHPRGWGRCSFTVFSSCGCASSPGCRDIALTLLVRAIPEYVLFLL